MSNPTTDPDLKDTDFDLNSMIDATQSLANDLTNHTTKKKRNRKKKKKKNAKKKIDSESVDNQGTNVETGKDKLDSILVGIEEYLQNNGTANDDVPVNIVSNQSSNGNIIVTVDNDEIVDVPETGTKEVKESDTDVNNLGSKTITNKPEKITNDEIVDKSETKDKLEDSELPPDIDNVEPQSIERITNLVYEEAQDPSIEDLTSIEKNVQDINDFSVKDVSIMDTHNEGVEDPLDEDIETTINQEGHKKVSKAEPIDIHREENKDEEDQTIRDINTIDEEKNTEQQHAPLNEKEKDPEIQDISVLDEPKEERQEPSIDDLSTISESKKELEDPEIEDIATADVAKEDEKDPEIDDITTVEVTTDDIKDPEVEDITKVEVPSDDTKDPEVEDITTIEEVQEDRKQPEIETTDSASNNSDKNIKSFKESEESEEEGTVWIEKDLTREIVEDKETCNKDEKEKDLNDVESTTVPIEKEEHIIEVPVSEKSHSVSVPVTDETPDNGNSESKDDTSTENETVAVNVRHDTEDEEITKSEDETEYTKRNDVTMLEKDLEEPSVKSTQSDIKESSENPESTTKDVHEETETKDEDTTEPNVESKEMLDVSIDSKKIIEKSTEQKEICANEESENANSISESKEPIEPDTKSEENKDVSIENEETTVNNEPEETTVNNEPEESVVNNELEKKDDSVAELNLDPTEETTGLNIGVEETTGLDIKPDEPTEKEIPVTDGKFTKKSLDDIFAETDAFLKELEFVDDSELNNLLNPSQNNKKTTTTTNKKTISKSDIRKLYENEPIYIYTSLAGGGFHMIPRTNRLATILQANQIKFTYRDLGTDDEARKVWKTHGKGRTLPGVVRGANDIIGNWEEIDDLNEDYRVQEAIYETL